MIKPYLRKAFRNTKAFYMRHFYDRRFHRMKMQYIGQCLLSAAVVLGVMIFLNVVVHSVVVASIGASAFIVFTMPHKRGSRVKYVLGGYLIGIIIGTFCFLMTELSWLRYLPLIDAHREEIFGAIAVGLTMFAMIMSNMEHPPAASLALGLVLDGSSTKIVTVALAAILITCIARAILKRWLINLL